MKSIITDKKILKKKQRKNQMIIAVILLGLMFISIAGYSFQTGSSEDRTAYKIKYNNQEFFEQNGFWVTEQQGQYFSFLTDPRKFPEVNSKINSLSSYQGQVIYLNYEYSTPVGELYRNILPYSSRYQEACVENRTDLKCLEEWPTKNCIEDIIIVILESNITSVNQQSKCLFIRGPSENLTAITDATIAKIVGI